MFQNCYITRRLSMQQNSCWKRLLVCGEEERERKFFFSCSFLSDRNTKDNVTVIVVNLGWSVELGADVGTAELDNLSPAFVQFLQKTELLPSVEEFHSSAVRGDSKKICKYLV